MLLVNNLVGFGVGSADTAITYATLNPSDKSANIALSGGNLVATGSTGFGAVRATISKNSGKWYFEATLTTYNVGPSFGFADGTSSMSAQLGTSDHSACNYPTTTTNKTTAFTTANALNQSSFAGGRVTMLAIDYDAGKIWLGAAGTWSASGDPGAGSNPWLTFAANTALYPAFGTNNGDVITVNFGASAFTYSVPSGFNSGFYS